MAGESLSDQRKRVEELAAREEELDRLRDRESDLEVEWIAAKAALVSASSRAPADVDAATATTVGLALAQRQMIAEALSAVERRLEGYSGKSEQRRQHLQAGRDALALWLEKPDARGASALQRGARIFLLVVTIACIVAEVEVHPAFLLLVVVVSGPVSFLMWRGQDDQWRQLGAQRRYDASGLAPLVAWDEAHVRARLGELDEALAAASVAPAETPSQTYATLEEERGTLAARLDAAEARVREALAAAGLAADGLAPELAQWLDLHARAERARLELEHVRARRRGARSDAEAIRDDVYRYLSRRGEAPADGHADSDALASRIDRLVARDDDER